MLHIKIKRVHFRFLLPIAVVMLLILSFFSWFELTNSQNEMMELIAQQSHTLLETITRAGENTLASNDFVEEIIIEDLLATAVAVRDRFESGQLTNSSIEQIAGATNTFRITVFNRRCEKLFQSSLRDSTEHQQMIENRSPCSTLAPIFNGGKDTLVLGLKRARFGGGVRLAVAVATYGRSAVVVNVDASHIIDFRKEIGFGKLLHKISGSKNIYYIALQDNDGLITKAGDVSGLESIEGSMFLSESLRNGTYKNRILESDSVNIFEAVYPLSYQGVPVGLMRVGLSLETLEVITKKVLIRVMLITAISGLFLIALVIAAANSARLDTLRRQYQEVETHANAIVQQTTDAIIVLDESNTITMFNNAAEYLFRKKADTLIGAQLKDVFGPENNKCTKMLESVSNMETVYCVVKEKKVVLLVSKSKVPLPDDHFSMVLIIRDITDTKRLEEIVERRERAEMAGQFASAVAHEIRNPLNTLSISLQQLRSDFKPIDRKDVYEQLTQLLISETERINKTVQSFLDFSRPAPIAPEQFDIRLFFKDVLHQFEATAKIKNVKFHQQISWSGMVFWDRNKIRQVLVNLYRNAIEAMDGGGTINIVVNNVNSIVVITISDSGPGIPADNLTRVFGLYFTTKISGNGLGLSIVQRIVDEHGGTISVQNDHGAKFTIQIPQRVETFAGKGA